MKQIRGNVEKQMGWRISQKTHVEEEHSGQGVGQPWY